MTDDVLTCCSTLHRAVWDFHGMFQMLEIFILCFTFCKTVGGKCDHFSSFLWPETRRTEPTRPKKNLIWPHLLLRVSHMEKKALPMPFHWPDKHSLNIPAGEVPGQFDRSQIHPSGQTPLKVQDSQTTSRGQHPPVIQWPNWPRSPQQGHKLWTSSHRGHRHVLSVCTNAGINAEMYYFCH